MSGPVLVGDGDLTLMLFWSIQRCLGGGHEVATTCAELVERYGSSLDTTARRQLIGEIRTSVRRSWIAWLDDLRTGNSKGGYRDECDDRLWLVVIEMLENQGARKSAEEAAQQPQEEKQG